MSVTATRVQLAGSAGATGRLDSTPRAPAHGPAAPAPPPKRRCQRRPGRVLGYVLRRTDSADDAADVLAEAFLVAWRRLDDAPVGEVSRLWLYGVARRVLANRRRGEQRRSQLADRLREELSSQVPLGEPSGEGTPLAVAFRSLADGDRELLALQGWEGLDAGEIATVLGCSRNAARIRLHRARQRLRAAIAAAQDPEGVIPAHARRPSPAPVTDPSSEEHPDGRERLSARAVDPILMRGEIS